MFIYARTVSCNTCITHQTEARPTWDPAAAEDYFNRLQFRPAAGVAAFDDGMFDELKFFLTLSSGMMII